MNISCIAVETLLRPAVYEVAVPLIGFLSSDIELEWNPVQYRYVATIV
jgi:hypothetical protein